MECYTRFDIRLTPTNVVYILESNGNPNLDKDDEFANSALKAGVSYNSLIQRIIELAFKRKA